MSVDKIIIEKNVPMPKKSARSKYPLKDMDVGDSFVAPISERTNVANAASREQILSEKRFTVRKVSEAQLRVWRTD